MLQPAQTSSKEQHIISAKHAIEQARTELKQQFNGGVSAAQLISNYTRSIDQIVLAGWCNFCADCQDHHQHMELIAVGGYGRAELHPYSDVDLLILVKQPLTSPIIESISQFIQFLWDIGLEVGHSVRTVKDCIKEAKNDITVHTNLLEARLLHGSSDLLSKLEKSIRSPRVWPADKFSATKIEEQNTRHRRFEGAAYSLEPNIKQSPGGLRDMQTILWLYNRHFGITSFAQMQQQGHLNEDEYRLLLRARNMLWKLRCGLHLIHQRREDRLLFDGQRELADIFGYQDTDSNLAVEQMMKRYYRIAQQVMYLNEVLLAHYQITYQSRFGLSVAKNLDDDFLLKDKMVALRDEQLFANKPLAMLALFRIMQQQEITAIHPDTIRSIRAHLHLVDDAFRQSDEAKKLFLDLFKDPDIGLGNALTRMNAYGLLGAYLPVFGAIVGQMQHDLFHVYTVDGHTLMVIEYLTRLREYEDEFPEASRILASLYRPERLFISALFHDIAKGRGGDHSELGQLDAIDFCRNHGMSDYDAELVGWLVLNHLRMSHFSQRRDISDPTVIKEFAELVGDQEHLDNLYLLTLADIRGTSPKVWNAWKGQLLLELYRATSQALNRGIAKPHNAGAHVEDDKRAALLKIEKQLGMAFNKKRVEQFWSTLSDEYFIRNEPFYIAWHASSLMHNNALDMPVVAVRFSERLEASMIFVYAPEAKNLLARVTAAVDQMDINIIEAQLHSSNNGFALYTFNAIITEPHNGAEFARLEQRLRTLILRKRSSKLVTRRSVSRALKHFPIEPTVTVLQHHSHYTALEVVAQDQPGLLHNVAVILEQHKLKLLNAKIATFGEKAEDVFFVQQFDGKAVTDSELIRQVQSGIISALGAN